MRYIVKHQETTDIVVGQNILNKIGSIVKPHQYTSFTVLCTPTTKKLFSKQVLQSLKRKGVPLFLHTLPNGEKAKSLECVTNILKNMIANSVDRNAAVVALGGGSVGDVATLIAGLYFRGIDCIQIPTTLLSQVDSSIGGKGGINIGKHKNTAGIIRQPRHVIVDYSLLETLPETEKQSGMGEVVKYAIAFDPELFAILEKQDPHQLPGINVITRCIQLKLEHIKKDPHDTKGIRALLNFGHTVGHAVELSSNLPHGHAIAVGMVFTLKLSHALKHITEEELQRSLKLLHKFNLPTTVKGVKKSDILSLIKKDKKTVHEVPRFVLLKKIGHTAIGQARQEIVEQVLQEILV